MTIDVTRDGFDARFPNTGVSSADVNSIYLSEGAEWVESSLGEKFTIPMSTNNLTASRLAYQKAWHLLRLRTLDPADSDEMGASLDKEIAALNVGEKAMILKDGSALYATKQQADPGEQPWSNTMQYTPTFGEDHPSTERVDPDKINDLRRNR